MSSTIVRILFYVAILLTADGCSKLVQNDGSGIYARVPVGSVLRLNQQIPIPPERARVWFKGDSLGRGAGSYEPVCGLEVRNIDWKETQHVEPGEFRIHRVQEMWAEVVQRQPRPAATVRFQLASYCRGDGGNAMIYEGYHFWLESKDQPNVMRLTCIGAFDDMPDAVPPTLKEIRESLGRYATLELVGDG